MYGDTANARALMLQELSSLAEANPALRDKMVFPQMAMSSLRNLFVQRCKSSVLLCNVTADWRYSQILT